MPITKSAEKALRQNIRRREMNLNRKKKLKSTIKDYQKSVSSNNIDDAKTKLPAVYQALDKAAKKGLIKKNKANRLKSRLTARLKTK
ncbi:MAG TPA: 30S ribosomal protein S20 [Candidatus Paceibacterota bacterium]